MTRTFVSMLIRGFLMPGCNKLPVHHSPPRLHVISADVLVIEVVGMLPDIEAQQRRRFAFHDWVILIWCCNNFYIRHQPRPAATKNTGCLCRKFINESLERPVFFLDRR